jgi:hypothetical protein
MDQIGRKNKPKDYFKNMEGQHQNREGEREE